MSGGRKHALKYPPLNAAGRAWEREQLRAWGLTDIVWDPEVECPWCRAKPLQWGRTTMRRRRHPAARWTAMLRAQGEPPR